MPFRYPQPDNERRFEQFCLRLLQHHWNCPQLGLYGRRGEEQHGLDIIDISGQVPFRAAQCKLHETDKSIPPAEIRAEVAKAKTFWIPLDQYTILTTARVTTHAQNAVLELNRQHRELGLFTIELITWDAIEDLLDQYPDVRDELYPVACQRLADVQHELTAIHALIEPGIAGLRSDALDAEIDEVQSHLDRHNHQVARILLQRIERRHWDALAPRQKYRVQANLANVFLAEGKAREAAKLLLDAKHHQPEAERALVNEAIAYEFLGETDRAFKLARELLEKFPASSKARASWLRTAPASLKMVELEQQTPSSFNDDPEVAVALALRAWAERDYSRMKQWARRAMVAQPEWPAPHFLFGQASLQHQMSDASQRDWPVQALGGLAKVREAEAAFTRTITLARDRNTAELVVDALLGRAIARDILGNSSGADADFAEVTRLAPDKPVVTFRYALHLQERGRLDEAVQAMHRAIGLGGGPEVEFSLALALRQRNSPGDRNEATELLVKLTSSNIPTLAGEAFYLAVDGLIEERCFRKAQDLLDTKSGRERLSVVLAVLCGRLRLAEGDVAAASRAADEALASVSKDTPWADLARLAFLLSRLDRHQDALPLWQRVNEPGRYGPDTRSLLECANRVGRHEITLDTCRTLREAGVADPWLLHHELDLLEHYDPEEAVRLLQAHLSRNPGDRNARLRLSLLGLTLGRLDLVTADPAALPLVGEVSPTNGRLVVEVLRRSGRQHNALGYAYELLRCNFSHPAAHQAFLAAMHSWSGSGPAIPAIQEAGPGTAVRYREEGDGRDKWIVIEDGVAPDVARNEWSAGHPLACELAGKRAGETFILARGSAGIRTATVQEVTSKYIYRIQDVTDQWQVRFPEVPWVEVYRLPTTVSETGEERFDFGVIWAAVDRRHRQIQDVEEAYRNCLIPIHLFTAATRANLVEVYFYSAAKPDLRLCCCRGSIDERAEATRALLSCNAVILDLSALSTLLLLEAEQIMERWPARLIVSQGTMQELRRMIERDDLGEPSGTITKTDQGYAYLPWDPEMRKAWLSRLRALIEILASSCTVQGCQMLAAVHPQRREELIGVFDRHGAESIVLGSQPEHVLWTDDLLMARTAQELFGAHRVWTQVVFGTGVATGSLDAPAFLDASAKLVGFGYEFTSMSPQAILHAGSLAGWDPDRWPLEQALDQFAHEGIPLRNRFELAIALIVLVYREQLLSERRQAVVIRIAERLASREGGLMAVRALIPALRRMFGLNVLPGSDAVEILRAWLAVARSRIFIPRSSIILPMPALPSEVFSPEFPDVG